MMWVWGGTISLFNQWGVFLPGNFEWFECLTPVHLVSAESFIEVSDVEEPPETQQSHVKAEEADDKSPSEETEEEEEESREEDSGIQSSDKSDEVSEAVDEAPAATSEWDHIDTVHLTGSSYTQLHQIEGHKKSSVV